MDGAGSRDISKCTRVLEFSLGSGVSFRLRVGCDSVHHVSAIAVLCLLFIGRNSEKALVLVRVLLRFYVDVVSGAVGHFFHLLSIAECNVFCPAGVANSSGGIVRYVYVVV